MSIYGIFNSNLMKSKNIIKNFNVYNVYFVPVSNRTITTRIQHKNVRLNTHNPVIRANSRPYM